MRSPIWIKLNKYSTYQGIVPTKFRIHVCDMKINGNYDDGNNNGEFLSRFEKKMILKKNTEFFEKNEKN